MNRRYHVDLAMDSKSVLRISFTVAADTGQLAVDRAKNAARSLGHYSRVLDATAELLVDDPDADDDEILAENASTEDAIGRPAQINLTTAQRLELAEIAKALPVRSATRLALELALQTDGIHRSHNWGPFGDAKYCRRTNCHAVNGPLANRQPCKGDA